MRLHKRIAPLLQSNPEYLQRNINVEFDNILRMLQDLDTRLEGIVEEDGGYIPPTTQKYDWDNLYKSGTDVSAREAFGDWQRGYEDLTTHIWKFIDPHSSHPEWTVGVKTPLVDSTTNVDIQPAATYAVRLQTGIKLIFNGE